MQRKVGNSAAGSSLSCCDLTYEPAQAGSRRQMSPPGKRPTEPSPTEAGVGRQYALRKYVSIREGGITLETFISRVGLTA